MTECENIKSSKKRRVNLRKKIFSESLTPYWFLAPALLMVFWFYGYPIVKSIINSFTRYNLGLSAKQSFIGFENYLTVFNDSLFILAAKNTFIWVFVSLIIQFLLGFGLALLLKKKFTGRSVYQSLVFIPWAISGFLIAIMFRWMFNAQFGVINDILLKVGLIKERIAFLSQPSTALYSAIIGCIWYGIPFFSIMILAALQSIPIEVYEAAAIDGIGKVGRFFKITLPFIKPVLVVSILLRVIWIFNSGDIIYVMTNGGPANSSHILPTYLFQKAYVALDFGIASSIATLMVLFLLVYTLVYLAVTKFEDMGDF